MKSINEMLFDAETLYEAAKKSRDSGTMIAAATFQAWLVGLLPRGELDRLLAVTLPDDDADEDELEAGWLGR